MLVASTLLLIITLVHAEYFYDKDDDSEDHNYELYTFTETDTQQTVVPMTTGGDDVTGMRPTVSVTTEKDSDVIGMRPTVSMTTEKDSDVIGMRPTVSVTTEKDSDVIGMRPTVSLRTLNQQELDDIKDALRMLLKNHGAKDKLFTFDATTDAIRTTFSDMMTMRVSDSDDIKTTDWPTLFEDVMLTVLDHFKTADRDNAESPTRSTSSLRATRELKASSPTRYSLPSDVTQRLRINLGLDNDNTDDGLLTEHINALNKTSDDDGDDDYPTEETSDDVTLNYRSANDLTGADNNLMLNARRQGSGNDTTKKEPSIFLRGNDTTTPSTTESTTRSRRRKTKTTKKKRPKSTRVFTYWTSTTKSRRKKTRYRTTPTTPRVYLDIPKLMELITNLTIDYKENLTDMVNKTLQEVANFSCPTPTSPTTTAAATTTVPTTTADPYGNLTGTIMAKCFVCGIFEPMMPRHARCADAFSGDFIPLVPVEATARKMLASYRKYCRWMNIPKYSINETDPRSMWGRWTGGCSVRWIDLSGIYTQRTCRNRHRAVMGNHWLSKRMAKLEMALQRIDNACIISPMASLVPLSRGMSLYARFHACVCTGSWCNRASPSPQCMLHVIAGTIASLLYMLFIP